MQSARVEHAQVAQHGAAQKAARSRASGSGSASGGTSGAGCRGCPGCTTGEVVLGVDTHDTAHVGVLLDALGRHLGALEVPATAAGHRQLLEWGRTHGTLLRAGVEGTGSYGAALTRFLQQHGVVVVEVCRPNRQRRRRRGKSDPADAEAAARATLSGEAAAIPKDRGGAVEAMRVLQVARASAVKARTPAANQLKALAVTAPDRLNEALRPLTTAQRVARCARLRPDPGVGPEAATKRALRLLALRWRRLDAEVRALGRELAALTSEAAPRLVAEPGVGPESAAKLLVAAGDNAERLRSDAAFAALCGASPVEASSGKVVRHRLNRGGDRQANNALWTIARNRLRHHAETRAYAARRTVDGRTEKEIVRCLMRHLARRLFPLLLADLARARAGQGTATRTSNPTCNTTYPSLLCAAA